MIGQRLLVRLITPSDRDELGRFYSKEWLDEEVTGDDGWRTAGASETAEEGELIGKIVGQIVAHLTFSRRGEMIRIESLYVARLLRRKRIGRFMVSELERLASDSRTTRVEAPADCGAVGFFRAIGFEPSAGARVLTKEISIEEDP